MASDIDHGVSAEPQDTAPHDTSHGIPSPGRAVATNCLDADQERVSLRVERGLDTAGIVDTAMKPPKLHILGDEYSRDSDAALQKLAEFFGLKVESVLVSEVPDFLAAYGELSRDEYVCAIGYSALQRYWKDGEFRRYFDLARYKLVYGFDSSANEEPALAWLTNDVLAGVRSSPAGYKTFQIHENEATVRVPVTGLSYQEVVGRTLFFEGFESKANGKTVISIDEKPYMVAVPSGRGTCFLLAQEALVDIERPMPMRSTSLREWYSQLIAISIFLRTSFGQWCWSAPVLGATFILDDPSLRQRYGCFDYQRLLPQVRRLGCALTLGFIPYNYRRSHPRTVHLLREMEDQVSLAVHGCDHTSREFAAIDETWLAGTTGCALDRMEAHEAITGLHFDRVFIFPQGRFSVEAVRAVQRCGFIAIVNSMLWPVNGQNDPLTIADLLRVAVTRYEQFPIFGRRYACEAFDLAFDALFQKPIFVAGYHDGFRDGFQHFAESVRSVSSLAPNVEWMPLGRAAAASCLLRRVGTSTFVVRHFADSLELRNPTNEEVTLSIETPERQGAIVGLQRGEEAIPFVIEDGMLKYTVELSAGATLRTTVVRAPVQRVKRNAPYYYLVRCVVRRALSDFRDNYLARSRRLLALVQKFRRAVLDGLGGRYWFCMAVAHRLHEVSFGA